MIQSRSSLKSNDIQYTDNWIPVQRWFKLFESYYGDTGKTAQLIKKGHMQKSKVEQ
jgi:hypothetical protein